MFHSYGCSNLFNYWTDWRLFRAAPGPANDAMPGSWPSLLLARFCLYYTLVVDRHN